MGIEPRFRFGPARTIADDCGNDQSDTRMNSFRSFISFEPQFLNFEYTGPLTPTRPPKL